jgi:hypothetical protein
MVLTRPSGESIELQMTQRKADYQQPEFSLNVPCLPGAFRANPVFFWRRKMIVPSHPDTPLAVAKRKLILQLNTVKVGSKRSSFSIANSLFGFNFKISRVNPAGPKIKNPILPQTWANFDDKIFSEWYLQVANNIFWSNKTIHK